MIRIKRLLLVCLIFPVTLVHAQGEKFKCTYDDWANRFNNNSEWNALLESACKDINASNYTVALSTLQKALAIDSAANGGDMNVFIESQYRRLKDYIEFSLKEDPSGASLAGGAATKETPVSSASQNQSTPEAPKTEVETAKVEETPVVEQETTSTVVVEENKSSPPATPEESAVVEPITTSDNRSNQQTVSEPSTSNASEKEISGSETEVAKTQEEIPVKEETIAQEEEITNANEKVVEEEVPTSGTSSGLEEPSVSDNGKVSFSDEEKGEFQEKGMQKIKQLESFLIQIGSKSTPLSMSSQAMDNAIQLFDKEDRTVQVSSVKNEAKPKFKVRTYLQKIRNLNYDDVQIEWADFQYASDFYLGKDGNYYAYIVFSQRFTGTTDNKVMYQDITTKRTEIVLKFYEKASQGELKKMWDVFLGDISVMQTESF
jgi:hypothetical protein